MNHESTPSSPARQPDGDDDTIANQPADQQDRGRSNATDSGTSEPPQRPLRGGLTKKLKFTTQLLRNLDALVYAELSALYYMECSLFRFCIRSFMQLTFLTPKSESFPLIIPAARTHVVSIFLPNVLCILAHLLMSLPTASEESRGYLHGGVMVDFIGQKAPTSRISLLFLDVLIFALQCLMLAVHAEREKLRSVLRPASQRSGNDGAATETEGDTVDGAAARTLSTQDHDAEERGVLRDAPNLDMDDADIELQPLRSHTVEEPAGDSERNPLLSGSAPHGRSRADLSDIMASGNAVLGEFHVLHTLRTAATDYQTAAAHSIQTLGYGAAIAALTARRRVGTAR